MNQIVLLLAGFICLIKGADYLIEGASSLAKRYKISDLVIGLTLVAFGTSAPELFVNILASLKGTAGIVVGNIIGSNIANIFLILGVASFGGPVRLNRITIAREIPLSLFSLILLLVLINEGLLFRSEMGVLSAADGIILLVFFVYFLYYSFRGSPDKEFEQEKHFEIFSLPKSAVYLMLGLCGLMIGAKWIVGTGIYFAEILGVSQSFIGMSLVAVGTSLPELATSCMAIVKKNRQMAVGNVVGSNIFNVFFVLGISAVIRPVVVSAVATWYVWSAIAATIIFLVSLSIPERRVISRVKGIIFLALYFMILFFLFSLE